MMMQSHQEPSGAHRAAEDKPEVIDEKDKEMQQGILKFLSQESLKNNPFIHPVLHKNLDEEFETYEGFNKAAKQFLGALTPLFDPNSRYHSFLSKRKPEAKHFFNSLKVTWARIGPEDNWRAGGLKFKRDAREFMVNIFNTLASNSPTDWISRSREELDERLGQVSK